MAAPELRKLGKEQDTGRGRARGVPTLVSAGQPIPRDTGLCCRRFRLPAAADAGDSLAASLGASDFSTRGVDRSGCGGAS